MSRFEPGILDCKVYVRRYLIKRQLSSDDLSLSRRGRNIVLVPSHSPEKDYGIVALRLSKGPSSSSALEREVGFTRVKDLVDHSSKKYEKLGISTEPFCQCAHGVVIKDGGSGFFSYLRGDKLWLFDKHASKFEDGGMLAPVVNLRTSEYGPINVAHVCWYPDVSGPDGDLWTVLGLFREIRGTRAGEFTRTIYRVNQPVSLKRQAFGQVRINNSGMAKEERKAMFLQKGQAMTEMLQGENQPHIDHPLPRPTFLSPPVSPVELLPIKPSRPRRAAKRRHVEQQGNRSRTIRLDGILQTPIHAGLQPVRDSTSSSPPVTSPADSRQISLRPSEPNTKEHESQVRNPYWTPASTPDPPDYSFNATSSSSMPRSDWLLLDPHADCGGVHILEKLEKLAHFLGVRPPSHPRLPLRPYCSFTTDSGSGSISTTTIPAWWGTRAIIAKYGFTKAAGGQIDIEVGEVVIEVERSAPIDVTKEASTHSPNPCLQNPS
ncbi:MAG: hypothetical protein M1839_008295 [Geoglossum umbratile]|nr:MAG: hypothetical protein M1839_008295 [Geoglossum umbratile]